MINILTEKGENFSFDPSTERIFKDGMLMSSVNVEPIYSNANDKESTPKFAGILLKDVNSIVSLSGKINKVTDINSITIL